MSKKKGTMTLKDFHGGSIPSDLPLPSAPGVTVRPTDGRGLDRQTPWGNPAGRSDHKLRPASAGSARNLDEKTPFLSHPSHIGRTFDEDERKPLVGVSGPRRTVCDEEIRSQSSHSREPNSVGQSGATVGKRPASVPTTQISSGSTGGSYAGRVSDLHNLRSSHQTSNYPVIGNKGAGMAGSHQNAWAIKKGTVSTRDPVLTTMWSAPDAAVKLAHASALEKVSSGLWSSKQQGHPLKDAEVFAHRETEGEMPNYYLNTSHSKKNYNRLDVSGDSDPYDVALAIHAERSMVVDKDIHARGKGVPSHEQNISIAADGIQSHRLTEISGGAEFEVTSPLERPKLKLLPRSKPLENLGQMHYNQDNKQIIDHDVENKYFVQEPKSPGQASLSLASDRAPERPKLNLKPRSQPLEQLEGNGEGKRTIFGQARPREVVLKERGIEDVSSYESPLPLRVKDGFPKAETFMDAAPVRYNDRSEFISSEHGTTQYSDRQGYHVDGDKIDAQRRNRQSETRRNNRDGEKHCNQQHDRPPSPKTWRRPIEQVKPASTEAPPLQYGKATPAIDLVQAFSKSVPSNPPIADRFSGHKGIPGRGNQMPFSRLVGPTPKPHVNGH